MRSENILYQRNLYDGVQVIYKFPNGYGASVVQHDMSYGGDEGKWELALITFKSGTDEWHLSYDDDFDDVVGYLTEDMVDEYLTQIENKSPLTHETST